MNDAFLVRGGETAGGLQRVVERDFLRKRPVEEPPAERLALEQLHDSEDDVPVADEVEDSADVRM